MELVVGASMKSVLIKLEGLLSQDHMLIRDAHSVVQCINGQLAAVHPSFLCNLDRVDRGSHDDGEQSERIRTSAREMRDVAYEAEDCVDHVRLQLSRRPEPRVRGLVSAIGRAWYVISTLHARRGLAAEIANLKIRAQLSVEGLTRFCVEDVELSGDRTGGASSASHHVAERTQPSLLLTGVEEPVGTERAMADVRSWLTAGEQDPQLRVLAIVGCGGLGKTTLAGALRREFGEQFDSQATVLASRGFNLGAFLRSLLKQIMTPFNYDELQFGGPDGWKDDELREKVEEQFLDKRFIVVIDDVWDKPSWKSIRESLPENEKGSRIVVTTRHRSLAEAICQPKDYVYTLNPLNADDSHRLLQRTLGDNHLYPCGTDSAASRIQDKCGGLPLAIVAVAGLLANRPASDSRLTRAFDSASSDLENGSSHEKITKEIFKLCYLDLPADLKTGLLCLSIFPVGFSIRRKRLIRRWIVEGFITEKHGKTVEQVAEESFNELIRRNLIQPVEISSTGKVKTFHVHDVIHENIVSESSEENFITVVNSYSPGLELARNKVRWLSIHRRSNPLCPKEVTKSMNLLHVRSLTAFGTLKHLDSFAILQVLDLEGCEELGTDQLIMICKMYLLKYLSLRRTYIRALPHRIGRLQCLETLDLRETNVRRLPRSVGQLKRMVHLLSGDKSRGLALEFTKEITKMSELQTLSGIKIHTRSTAALERMCYLTKLNKLSSYILGQHKNINPNFLSYSSSLKCLAIDDGFTGFHDILDSFSAPFDYLHTLKLSGKLSKVPHWINRMQCLEELTLSLTSLRTDSLVLLSSLPKLYFLVFSLDAAKQYPNVLVNLQGEIFIPAYGFHCLRSLRFSGAGLPLLSFLQGSMPGLQRLELRFRMFDGVYGLENLASLQKVHLEVSKQASQVSKEKVRQIRISVNNHPRRPAVICDEYPEW